MVTSANCVASRAVLEAANPLRPPSDPLVKRHYFVPTFELIVKRPQSHQRFH